MNDNTLLFYALARKKSELARLNTSGINLCVPIELLPCITSTSSSKFRFYSQQAKDILKNITELRDLILDNRTPYILSSTILPFFGESLKHIEGIKFKMSADGCKMFDKFSDIAVSQCSSLIQSFQRKIFEDGTLRLEDESRHLQLVAHSLRIYLKDVCSIVVHMRELKNLRLQRYKKFGRLSNLVDMWEDILLEQDTTQRSFYSHLKRNGKYQSNAHEAQAIPKYENEATSLELEKLHGENVRIFQRLANANPDIQQIESHLIEIQQLQDLFNEKIIEQDRDIDEVHTRTEHTLNTLGDANQFIRKVLNNQASRRVIALFSLIVLSFTLLFVDWYNP